MKTTTVKTKSMLVLTGIVILCNTMMSCTSVKTFTGSMKYSYLKKVRAQSKSDSLSVAKNEELIKENFVPVKSIIAKQEKSLAPQNKKPLEKNKVTSMNSVSSVKKSEKTAQQPKSKKTNVVKFIKNKVNKFYPSKSNTKDVKNPGDNILLTILIIILGIIIAYIVLVLFFFLLMQLGGFSFAIGC